MPELPEVETIKRSLEKQIVGKTIKSIEINKLKQFKGEVKDVIGKKIVAVERKGKMLLIRLGGDTNRRLATQRAQKREEGTEMALLIHNKMSGQLVWSDSLADKVVFGNPIPFAGGNSLPGRTTHIIIKTDKGTLFFNDLRQFGWVRIIKDNDPEIKKLLGKLGPEPFNKNFTTEYLKKIFSKTSKAIKLVLLDQEKIAGVGNIYANDALFEAGILPTRSAKTLKNDETEKLKNSIIKVLEDGIKYGGSSAGDEAYVKPDGTKGNYQDHALVYQKDGQKCPRCGGIILRSKIAGRGTFFCPGCQR